MSIATQRDPLVIGIPNEVVCSTSEPTTSKMEMILTDTNTTIATANDTSRLAMSVVPESSMNEWNILCRVYTDDGQEFENTKTLQLRGEHSTHHVCNNNASYDCNKIKVKLG